VVLVEKMKRKISEWKIHYDYLGEIVVRKKNEKEHNFYLYHVIDHTKH